MFVSGLFWEIIIEEIEVHLLPLPDSISEQWLYGTFLKIAKLLDNLRRFPTSDFKTNAGWDGSLQKNTVL